MIIQIAGTSGAGKSYVVRHLIANSRYVATIKLKSCTLGTSPRPRTGGIPQSRYGIYM